MAAVVGHEKLRPCENRTAMESVDRPAYLENWRPAGRIPVDNDLIWTMRRKCRQNLCEFGERIIEPAITEDEVHSGNLQADLIQKYSESIPRYGPVDACWHCGWPRLWLIRKRIPRLEDKTHRFISYTVIGRFVGHRRIQGDLEALA